MSQMTEQMFNDRLKEIKDAYKTSKNNLYREYALLNAKFKKGDIVTDGRDIILVQKITAYKGFGFPEIVYEGIILKKDLTPKKKDDTTFIYDSKATLLNPHNP